MKKKLYCFIGVVVVILVLVIVRFLPFGRGILPFSASKIFTEDAYKQLKEIDYWAGDTKLVINKEADMRAFYNYLAAMKLRGALSPDTQTDGGLNVDLVMKNETMSIGWRSNKIKINGKGYYVVKNIDAGAREIAMKYMNYYKNDIFTKNMFEDLVEMDCWIRNEKLVIKDSTRLENAYHYLSGLTLEEASPDYKFLTEPLQMSLVTKDSNISFSVTPKAICINDKYYYTDSPRDLVELMTSFGNQNY